MGMAENMCHLQKYSRAQGFWQTIFFTLTCKIVFATHTEYAYIEYVYKVFDK